MQESQTCIFCRIASGESKSQKVYEDDVSLAILDIRPINQGHTLVIPKEHFENIHEIPEDLLAHLHKVAKKVAAAQKRALNPLGIGIAQNNGAAAGQVVFHFHIHVIPKDKTAHQRPDKNSSDEELEQVAREIRGCM